MREKLPDGEYYGIFCDDNFIIGVGDIYLREGLKISKIKIKDDAGKSVTVIDYRKQENILSIKGSTSFNMMTLDYRNVCKTKTDLLKNIFERLQY